MILRKLRRAIQRLGYDVRRANFLTIEGLTLVHLLKHRSIRTVLDVGANVGQFAEGLLEDGFDGNLISFEPNPDANARLVTNARNWSNWAVAPPAALGASAYAADFHVSANSVSSSLISVLDVSTSADPQTAPTRTIKVPVRRLDDVLDELGMFDEPVFLKVDTQGTEKDVFEGASRILPRVTGVMVEMSIVQLYQGQCVYDEMDAYLRQMGFALWDLAPGFRDPNSARLLQFDGIYFR